MNAHVVMIWQTDRNTLTSRWHGECACGRTADDTDRATVDAELTACRIANRAHGRREHAPPALPDRELEDVPW